MKATFTKRLILACAAIFAINLASAQDVFWSESFTDSGDLPTGWTTEDLSGGAAAWAWCNDPTATNPCIINWATYSNQHDMSFFSTSGEGHIYMDSDGLAAVAPDHIATVTSAPIDCSDEPVVWAKFESLVGVFGSATTDNVLLRVSTDNMNWTDYNLFDIAAGNTGNEPGSIRWTNNPDISLVNISDIAGGASTVYLQWSWTGNYEYYWLLDDIELYDADPTPLFVAAFDMRVNGNFFAIAPNALTPASQVQQFGFLADIENVGAQASSNVNLNVTITDDGSSAVVYTEDLAYGTIAADSLAENEFFTSDGFTPDATPGTSYSGTYVVSADSMDLIPDNNTQNFNFFITDTLLAKENGATRTITPAAGNWDDGEPHSWAYGNCFYLPNGDGLNARYGTFTIANAADVSGRLLSITLYEWTGDTNTDNNADPDERVIIAQNIYEVQGTEAPEDLISMPLIPFGSSEVGAIPLANDKYYMLMLEYQTADVVDFSMTASEEYDYSAMNFRSDSLNTLDPTNPIQYGAMLGVAGMLGDEPYSSVGFGLDIVPVVRLSIGEEALMPPNAVEDILSDDNKLVVSPNPASSFINLNLDLVEAHDEAIIRILDVAGKVITERAYFNVQNESFNYNVSNYTAGTYFIHFISQEGSKTVPFIVTK